MEKSFFNFNKQILAGEAGAWVSAPLIAWIVSRFTGVAATISAYAVIGSIIGGSGVWLAMRVHDRKAQHAYSFKNLATDVAYFTPVAFIFTALVYYPVLFFLSEKLILGDHYIIVSVLVSQFIAFSLFFMLLNAYRYFLKKFTGKAL